MTLPSVDYPSRHKKIGAILQKAGLDALAVNVSPSLTYLTGLHFHLSERPVVVVFTPDHPPLVVLPELETVKVQELNYKVDFAAYGEDPATWKGVFRDALKPLKLKKIGVESRGMRLLEYHLISGALPSAKISNAPEVVAEMRMVKDESEIALMQKAVEIAEAALKATLPLIKIGMSEQELANELVIQLLRHGSQSEIPFQPIISTGPNGANPHATPTDRPLAAGDMLVIDYGANYQGYFSDITRTFGLAEVSPKQKEVYQFVLAANTAARQFARPGVSCHEVDRAAREVIEKAGYGPYFTHRTGHGLGREGHEDPYIRADNPMLLQPGMTFTIEPGIYLYTLFGVRIEDDVVVTANGLRSLTSFPRELQIIGG